MKLTPQQIKEIRTAVNSRQYGIKKRLAKEYGVALSTIYYYTTPGYSDRHVKDVQNWKDKNKIKVKEYMKEYYKRNKKNNLN